MWVLRRRAASGALGPAREVGRAAAAQCAGAAAHRLAALAAIRVEGEDDAQDADRPSGRRPKPLRHLLLGGDEWQATQADVRRRGRGRLQRRGGQRLCRRLLQRRRDGRLGRRRGGCREHRSPKTGLQRRDGKRVTVRAAPPRRRGDLRAPEGERGKAALLAVWHRREGRKRKVGCAPLALLRLPQSVYEHPHTMARSAK